MLQAIQQEDMSYKIQNARGRWVEIAFSSILPLIIDQTNSHHSVRGLDPATIEVVPYVAPPEPTPEEIAHREALSFLAETDAKMTRTQEDMIDALGVYSSLPVEVQDLYTARKAARLDLISEMI